MRDKRSTQTKEEKRITFLQNDGDGAGYRWKRWIKRGGGEKKSEKKKKRN
ncbi:hypothetical protein WN55_07100 [Dufourea novaeangliae]|uniref:Uncharacterized protein n=1 Tax=Dufourea novaeangliae TaxID=178035 RepID=A0A154PSP3_DUFNO|nr:hypothetical protein WN55_07100 [Dufourea novaeangliae]